MSEVMMLSKNYDPSKCSFPVYVSEKLDGVPGVYTKEKMQSRQSKPLLGVQWIHDKIKPFLPDFPIIGEHYKPGMNFGTISGKCRKDEAWRDAELWVFDADIPNTPFHARLIALQTWWCNLPGGCMRFVKLVPQYLYETPEGLQRWIQDLEKARQFRPVEGAMIRPTDGLYTLTRSWASQKYVFEDTLDLKVLAYEEAVDKYGEPKGMVGAIWCSDATGAEFKVGAGKMKHDERTDMFQNPFRYIGRICKVKAKPDPGYKALRQATFQAWHDDKEEPDAVG